MGYIDVWPSRMQGIICRSRRIMQHFRLRYEFIYIVMRATGCDGSRALAPIHLPMKFMVGVGGLATAVYGPRTNIHGWKFKIDYVAYDSYCGFTFSVSTL